MNRTVVAEGAGNQSHSRMVCQVWPKRLPTDTKRGQSGHNLFMNVSNFVLFRINLVLFN